LIIVLDTNVLVSGLLKGNSPPGLIVRHTAAGLIRLAYDYRILEEYSLVLRRPKFAFPQRDVKALLTEIEADGLLVSAPTLNIKLPDPADRPFYEVAATLNEALLVTGNLKHYPRKNSFGVNTLSSVQFIKLYTK